MLDRLELHEKFCEILGSRNVYFQPPETVKIVYPAIIYSLAEIRKIFANNRGYILAPRYEAILIDKKPDSEYVVKMLDFQYSSFDRSYASDNLNHFVFTIYHY